jgi:MoaF N-terminal domain
MDPYGEEKTLTSTLPLPPAAQPDKIGGPSTRELDGTVIEYRYTTGHHYRMNFAAAGITFTQLDIPGGHTVGPIPYRARQLREDFFLVSWIIKPGIHVSLILDFEQLRIHVSAMMPPNQWEFFDIGELLHVDRDSGER